MNDQRDRDRRYGKACRGDFWQRVFRLEADFIAQRLVGCRDILSVGCGPAIVEGLLAGRGFRVTALDASRDMLGRAPRGVDTMAGLAEKLPFSGGVFDAVIFVVSLQFVGDFRAALEESSRVLRPGGRIVAMLLNPASGFFRQRRGDPASYVSGIRHADPAALEKAAAGRFDVRGEYFLRLEGERASPACGEPDAALYVFSGVKRIAASGEPRMAIN